MNKLIPGVRVLCHSADDAPSLLQVCEGTQHAVPTTDLPYLPEAVIPRGQWRDLTQSERACLSAPMPADRQTPLIEILQIPPLVLESYAELRQLLSAPNSQDRVRSFCHSTTGKSAAQSFCTFANSISSDPSQPQQKCIIVAKPADMPTTTEDVPRKGLNGLHLDNWTRLPLDGRKDAENRIVVNLGIQDRFLLFLNIPIEEVCEHVMKHARKPDLLRTRGTEVARIFFALFPDYPIVRIRLGPGKAYIAPTERVIHDGSSEGSSTPDVTLMLRGNFTARTCCAI